MKALRLYSIQSKFSLLLLIAVFIIICGDIFSQFFSKRILSSTEDFVNGVMPKVRAAISFEHATTRLAGFSRELTKKIRSDTLEDRYAELTTALEQLEVLTVTMSQGDSRIDILYLNFLSQAIRSHAGVVFQIQTQIIMESERIHLSINTLKHGLSSAVSRVSDFKQDDYDNMTGSSDMVDPLHSLLPIADKLELVNAKPELLRLHGLFANNIRWIREHVQVFGDTSGEVKLKQDIDDLVRRFEELFMSKNDLISAEIQLSRMLNILYDLSGRWERMTGNYVESVFGRFQSTSEQMIAHVKLFIRITLFVGIGAVCILCLLYWLMVVRGFGRRLSMISRAMVDDSVEKGIWNLPVDGQDEIADMARSTSKLLSKARKLRELARIDELTKVYNRRVFFELAQKEEKRSQRTNSKSVVLMLDIDHFKKLNDVYGHDFGDSVLFATAQECKRLIREMDVFARYGGEEFALLMPETRMDRGAVVANRLLEAVAGLSFSITGADSVHITMSVGMTEVELQDVGIDGALKQADIALYRAKAHGRNRVEAYEF